MLPYHLSLKSGFKFYVDIRRSIFAKEQGSLRYIKLLLRCILINFEYSLQGITLFHI